MTETEGPFTLGPRRLAPEATTLTPMPHREVLINARAWPGGELEPQLERALAGVTILARKAGIHDIAEQIDKEIASVKKAANVESMEFHISNVNKKVEENLPAVANELKKILKDESLIFVGDSLKTWKEIEKMNCGRPNHDFSLSWFVKCLMEGKRLMIFGDAEKKGLRNEVWQESTGYFFCCQQCYQNEVPVRRYIAQNVRIRKK